jgi:GYF domain 2
MGLVAIYVNRKGQQMGPYDSSQVNRLLLDGELSPEDLGWHKGMEEWVPLAQLEALTNPVEESAASQHIATGASPGPARQFATRHLSDGDIHFQAVGTCWYLFALVVGIIGAPLCLYGVPRHEFAETIVGLTLLVAAFIYGMLGGGVRRNARWAQPLSMIGAIILIPFIPFGTIVGLYALGELKKSQKK